MPRVVHFEIGADEPERAVKFYQEAFGWEITKWEGDQPYWLSKTGPDEEPGINGAIMPRTQGQATVNTIGVSDIDDSISKIEAAGGKVVTEKMQIPEVGIFAYCVDTEGNSFGIIQAEPMD